MGYFGYKPYVPVATRRAMALTAVAKANKKGTNYAPIAPYTGAIAKTFWGKAWCSNLEQYSDYASRLPRGRSYVRNGAVIDLQISTGSVRALVMGSSLYEVKITIQALPEPRWKAVCAARRRVGAGWSITACWSGSSSQRASGRLRGGGC